MIFNILEIILGVCMFVFGGYDDSPGAQLLGLIAFIFGIWGIVKTIKNKKNKF